MDVIFPGNFHRIHPVVGLKKLVALRCKINFQCVHNVLGIVADQNVIHFFPSWAVYDNSIPFKLLR